MQDIEFSDKLKLILYLVEDLSDTEYYQLQREITPFAIEHTKEDSVENNRFEKCKE